MDKKLTKKEINDFREFYIEIMSYSHIDRLELEEYYIDDIPKFITAERSFFYKNRHSIIAKYIKLKRTPKAYKNFLKAVEKGIYDDFHLISYTSNCAILADGSYKLYSVYPYSEPFDKLFRDVKDMEFPIVRTTILPYKGRYIIDGVLPMHESHSLTKKMLRRFMKKHSPKPKNSSNVIYIPVHINIVVHSDEDSDYDKLEYKLMDISEDFTKTLFPIFDKEFIDNVSLLSSFVPTFTLLEDEDRFFQKLDDVKDNFNRLNITNFHKFKKTYKIKVSPQSDDNAKMFYTLCGVIEIEEDKQDDFDKLIYNSNRDKKIRENIIIGIENLFREINEQDNLEMDPILIGISSYNFESIDDSLTSFLEFVKLTKYSVELMKHYSIHRHKIIGQSFKVLFSNFFKKV